MKNSIMLKTILFVLGLVLIVLGTSRLVDPIAFFANSGIQLSNDVSLLNEIRGLDGPIVGFGILVMLGAFIRKLAFTSTIAAIVFFRSVWQGCLA